MDFSSPEAKTHEPVLLEEVLRILDPQPGQVVVDATLGSGGHSREILKRIGPRGRLIGIDQDPEAIERAKRTLKPFSQVEYVQENFSELDKILKCLNLKTIDAVILDVGLSMEQLESVQRGFSFLKEGPLDMRMGSERPLRARDLVNDLSQEDLERIFRTYGEERWARRIATSICRDRIEKPIETTMELVQSIQKAIPARFRFGPRHAAMRVFQALRICVNRELDTLQTALPKAEAALCPGGRLAVITFHSLEDRIVKRTFREWKEKGKAKILTPKPIVPSTEEIERNPRSRSAKLRAIEKISLEEN